MTAAMADSRPAIDVSKLPSSALDHRSPIWWGNALLLCIETSMFAIVIASYYYFRRNFDQWPPPQVNTTPPIPHPLPLLFWGNVNLALLRASAIPMYIGERACLRMNEPVVKWCATIGAIMS